MQGRNCCFMKKKVGKLLEVRITTGEDYNLLWTREKSGTLEMLSPLSWHAIINPGAGV